MKASTRGLNTREAFSSSRTSERVEFIVIPLLSGERGSLPSLKSSRKVLRKDARKALRKVVRKALKKDVRKALRKDVRKPYYKPP